MNTTNYNKAVRYALKLKYNDHLDLVHDAYLRWYEKEGEDLFDKPLGRILRVVKLTFLDFLKRGKYQTGPKGNQNGTSGKFVVPKETGRRQFISYNEHVAVAVTPEDIMIADELDTVLQMTDSKIQLDIYLLAVQGFRPYEIAELLGMGKNHVSYYFKKIRHIASYFN